MLHGLCVWMGVGSIRNNHGTWLVRFRPSNVALTRKRARTNHLHDSRHVYTQNLWSFLDVTFALIYWIYLVLRAYGWKIGSIEPAIQALDVLAMGAPVLIPRLAFNLLSDNLLFLSLRSMMSDFALLSALAAWYVTQTPPLSHQQVLTVTHLIGVFLGSCCP